MSNLSKRSSVYFEPDIHTAFAIKRVIAWEIKQKMDAEHISKTKMAELMGTSRSALDRVLDPANTSVTLHTLDDAARAVGKTLRIELS